MAKLQPPFNKKQKLKHQELVKHISTTRLLRQQWQWISWLELSPTTTASFWKMLSSRSCTKCLYSIQTDNNIYVRQCSITCIQSTDRLDSKGFKNDQRMTRLTFFDLFKSTWNLVGGPQHKVYSQGRQHASLIWSESVSAASPKDWPQTNQENPQT